MTKLLTLAAIALAATIGSASAADPFSTLEGIAADAMTPQEMGVVKGAGSVTHARVVLNRTNAVTKSGKALGHAKAGATVALVTIFNNPSQ